MSIANPSKNSPANLSSTTAQLLQATLDSSLDMIQVFEAVRDSHGKIIDFVWVLNNHTSEKIYGNVLGKSLLQHNPGVVKEGIFDTFIKVVETGIADETERHYKHEQFDGWFHQSVVKMGDGVVTTTANITERKKVEADLRITKESLHATLDSSPYTIQAFKAIRNKVGKIIDFSWVFTNNSWNKLYGDVIGKSLLQLNPGVIETGLFEKFIQVTETGIIIDHEQYYSHEQFNDQFFHQTLVKMGDGFVMHVEDITERKRAEAEILRLKDEIAQKATDKYYSIFNSIDEGFLIHEMVRDDAGRAIDFRLMEVNPAFARQTGLGQDTVGKRASEYLPNLEQCWIDVFDRVARSGKPERVEEYNQATYRWYNVHISRVGREDRVAVLFEDVTERKQREQHQEFILRFSDALRLEKTADAVANKAIEMLFNHLQVDRSWISEVFEEQGISTVAPDCFRSDLKSMSGVFQLSDYPETMRQLTTHPVVIPDTANDSRFSDSEKELLAGFQLKGLLTIPLRKAPNQVIWAMVVATATPHNWTEAERVVVEKVAERTWAAIERAKAEQALQNARKAYQNQLEQEVSDRTRELLESRDEYRREHHFLEQVTDKTPLLIYVYDIGEKRFTYINKRVEELLGRDQEYVYAMGPHLFQAILHPHDLPLRAAYFEQLVFLKDGEVTTSEFRIWNGNSFRWFRSRDSIFIKEEFVIKQVIGIAEDITYEKMLQEKNSPLSGPVGLN